MEAEVHHLQSPFPEWQSQYQAALLELDREKAVGAGCGRRNLEAISQDTDHRAERQAIADALVGIRVLMKEKLEFPDAAAR